MEKTREMATEKSERVWQLSDLQLGLILGTGKFGVVLEAKDVANGRACAVKTISKAGLKREFVSKKRVAAEIAIQSLCSHPHILRLFGHFQDEVNFYLVLELAEGGDLYEYRKKRGRLDAVEVKHVLSHVISGLVACHAADVIYRDLKQENVLLCGPADANGGEKVWKLADMGWAIQTTQPVNETAGTLDIISPEIVESEPYDHRTDIWSLGVLIYELLVGKSPFYDMSIAKTCKNIVACKPDYHGLSPAAADLLSNILVVDPAKRLSLDAILHHEWMLKGDSLSAPPRPE